MKVNTILKRKGLFTNFLNSLLGQEVASLSIITVCRQMASYAMKSPGPSAKKLGWELFTANGLKALLRTGCFQARL
jgi:hypothetical protein